MEKLRIDQACSLIVDCPHSTPAWTDAGALVFRSHNIRNGRLDLSIRSYTTVEEYRARNRRATPSAGDLIITREAPMGEVALIPDGVNGCLGQRMVLLRPVRGRIEPRFLLYALMSPRVQAEISVHEGTGSTVSNLRIPALKAIEVPAPTFEVQQRVAGTLGVLDDKIELNRQMNETLEAMARAVFKSWFVDFDPVRAKVAGRTPIGMDAASAALFPSSLPAVESDWPAVPLGDLFELDKGVSYKGDFLGAGGAPMVNLGCFRGEGVFDEMRIKGYSGEVRDRHWVNAGDLVIANTDMTQHRVILGSPALVPGLQGARYVFSHHVFAARFHGADSEGLKTYCYYALLQPDFRRRASGYASGTTVLALPRDAVLRLEIRRPPVAVLRIFPDVIRPLRERVALNHRESRTLAELRDLLLPKLLSGELRIRDAERLVEAAL